MRDVELLAPVGSFEALKAAVQNGANAVYLGGKDFGARASANNFDRDELKEAVKYAHIRGVQVFVTTNTLRKENEIEDFLEYAKFLYDIDVDAIILQDIGMARLIKRELPDFELHASTQMVAHSLEDVKYLESVGFDRVVLAREVTVEEIKYICDNCKADIEVFVHGALCVCYSGQCLMSSMIGNRSGNRGRCAQPCRQKYTMIDISTGEEIHNNGDYLLSTKDLNTIEEIDKIIDTGVLSLKIEGRMKKPGYYSSGEFARMAHVTLRTIRYYDKQNILKPSYVSDSGARFYTDEDFARLQQILLLKYLGFSLDDIRDMTIDDADYHFMLNSLNIQLKLVRDRIEQMQLVEQAIQDTSDLIQKEHSIDWSQMLNLIHLTGMEKSMKNQYQDASNISARINLHSLYSQNTKGWFPWIFEQLELKPGMKVLELGCGDGTLWNVDRDKIPEQTEIVVSDISDGMLRDARRTIGADDSRFRFRVFDAGRIPYDEDSFDLVIANHVLFYCENIPKVCKEVKRVLKPGGRFVCSTYGNDHMREVSELVQKFDDRIVLAAKNLYERFGKENGEEILKKDFEKIEWRRYEDSLIVPEPEPLISYILSCHGNQGQYILDHYKEFQSYVRKKTEGGFHITKDAGIFVGYIG